jgi:hypothetical protein
VTVRREGGRVGTVGEREVEKRSGAVATRHLRRRWGDGDLLAIEQGAELSWLDERQPRFIP